MIESAVLNSIDYVAIAIIVISALVGFIKGIIKSIFTTLAIVLAAVLTLYAKPYFLPYVHQYLGTSSLFESVATFAVFAVLGVVMALLSNVISNKISENALGGVDHALGLMFGLARGALIISALYVAGHIVLPELPKVMVDAKFAPWYEEGAQALSEVLPQETFNSKSQIPATGLNPADVYKSIENLDKTIKDLSTLKPGAPTPNPEQKDTPDAPKTQW